MSDTDQADTVHPFNPDEPAPQTAKTRLRTFEDDMLGDDAVRISGQIEKGHGSHFKTKMTENQRRHHGALERLVEAEEKLAHASAHLAKAETDHEKAKADVEVSEGQVEGEQHGRDQHA